MAELYLPANPIDVIPTQTMPANRQNAKKLSTKDASFASMLNTAVRTEGEEQEPKANGNISTFPNQFALMFGLSIAQIPAIQDTGGVNPAVANNEVVLQGVISNATSVPSAEPNLSCQNQFGGTFPSPIPVEAVKTEGVQPVILNNQQMPSLSATPTVMQPVSTMQPKKVSEGVNGIVYSIADIVSGDNLLQSPTIDTAQPEVLGKQNQINAPYIALVPLNSQQSEAVQAGDNENSNQFVNVNVVENQIQPFKKTSVLPNMQKSVETEAIPKQPTDEVTSELERQQQLSSESAPSFKETLARVDLPGSKEPSSIQGSQAVKSEAPNPNMPTDRYNVTGQIVEHAKLVNRNTASEMIIKLKPEHLGELTLKITVDSGVVNATFHTNNNEVRSIIEATLPQLKQDISNVGLKVENVGVYAGLEQFFSNNQQGTASQQVIKLKNRKSAQNYDKIVEETTTATSVKTAADGVDYRI